MTGRSRIRAVDRLRGLVVVLMAMDHANYFVARAHSSGEYWGGSFPAYATAGAFLARLLTHPAAAGFFFLMGVSMTLYWSNRLEIGWTRAQIRRHFLFRGLVLIALQLLVINRVWELSPDGWGLTIYIGVLTALGAAMLVCTCLVGINSLFAVIPAVLLLIATELLCPPMQLWTTPFHPLLRILLIPGGTRLLWVNYPLLPWLSLTLLGLAFGKWLQRDPQRVLRHCLWIGAGALLLFLLLRLGNGFGNIRPRSSNDWIGFLNVVKYPPSLTYILLTMGFNLVLLGLFSLIKDRRAWAGDPLLIFGRTPLFFYLLHLPLYAAAGYLFAPGGTSLTAMLLYWLLGLALLYPPCLGFWSWKRRSSSRSLLRLL
jgi:uncharacterized membrane protein